MTTVVQICIRTQNAIISRFPRGLLIVHDTHSRHERVSTSFLSVDFKIHFLAQSMIYDLLAHLFVCWIQLDLCKIFPCIPSVKCTCMDISMQGLLPNLPYSGSPARLPFPTECINFISLGAKFVIVNYWLQKGLRLVYLRKIISVLVSILLIISCLIIFSKIVAV